MKTSNLILIAIPLSIAIWSMFHMIKINIEHDKKMKQIDAWYETQMKLLQEEDYV